MKLIVGVLLSLSLLLAGVPVSPQNLACTSPELVTKEAKETEQETDVQQEEGTLRKENVQDESVKEENTEICREKESEEQEPETAGNGRQQEQGTPDATGQGEQATKEEREKQGQPASRKGESKEKKQPAARKAEPQKADGGKAGQQGQKPEETMDRTMEERQASPPTVTLVQDGNTKNLTFKTGEMRSLDPDDCPDGYHTEVSRKIICKHTAAAINASVKCKKANAPLNPTQSDLKGNVALTGKLRGKGYTARVESFDAGGTRNTVSHLRLMVTVNAGGIKNQAIKLASPYVCGDGYAGYAYFENHFAYCPNTEQFYTVASSHVWLGCTRGDVGNVEFHPTEYQHGFNVYKEVPNKYKVAYDANGGTGSANDQNATYGAPLTLNRGTGFKRTGHTLTGWNTKRDGSGTPYALGGTAKNLTTRNGGTATLYAQWTPNILTVRYHPNGGEADRQNAAQDINYFTSRWSYTAGARDPVDFSTFLLSRHGYARKAGAEWNTRADGSGTSFAQDTKYSLTEYAPDLTTGSRTITLYAQWEPNVHAITLDSQLEDPDRAGTEKLYSKFETGIFFNERCTMELEPGEGKIETPQKEGYRFKGYYDRKDAGKGQGGRPEINGAGMLNPESDGSYRRPTHDRDLTWYAWYDYLVSCEDYADIPCDIGREEGDVREDIGISLSFDQRRRIAAVDAGQPGCRVALTGQPAGTKVGEFTSAVDPGSAAGGTGRDGKAQFTILQGVPEGAAYRLEVTKDGRTLHDRMVYYEDGRFRTLARLGEQEPKAVSLGGSIAGSAWGTYGAYGLYQYHGCTEARDVKEPGTVQRYFRYKDVNMAYSGNGATAGRNTLEYDVSLEDMYQFRDNGFTKEKTEKKYTADKKEYECTVKYGFQGWEMKISSHEEKEQKKMTQVYNIAKGEGALSDHTTEDISTYQGAEPVRVLLDANGTGTYQASRGTRGSWEAALQAAAAPKESHAKEYINLAAKWNAFPTIAVTPGEKLEFYEGEDVTKEDLTRRLTSHDNEDNHKNNRPYIADLNDKLRIVKISYPEPENHSQEAYEETYENDVPEGFLLDTYYLKLEEDESVDVRVTFAVTDSTGNTTEEEIPVKVKYNHYPEISSEDTFYYLKEEANRGEITGEALTRRAKAQDKEDGNITMKISLRDFDPQTFKMQTESKKEFDVTYQVTDAYKKTTYRTVKVMVWDEDASIAEMPKYYVRYISEKYLDTLEEGSTWREPENLAYLKAVLRNGTPMETWDFSHEDVLAVQEWITENGEGSWKIGQEANRQFLAKFAHCRQ